MSRIITTTVYTLDELSYPAQKKARDWYRQHHADSNWYENVYEGFREVCDIFGIDLRQRVFRLSSGSQQQPGESGSMPHRSMNSIVSRMPCRWCRNVTSWQLQAEISHRGRYCHPYSMDITVTRNSPTGQAMTTDAEAAVSEALRDLAFWLYRQLENEYDWLTSDAAVDEALLINEYTFTEAGLRVG